MTQFLARTGLLAVLAVSALQLPPMQQAAQAADSAVRTLAWEDLMPPGEEERLQQAYDNYMASLGGKGMVMEGSPADSMEQIGTFNVVQDLDGKEIRIPGFPVPLDMGGGGTTKEFLLVPYFGACIHSPPPPPNQVLYIRSDKPVSLPTNMDPVWVQGKLTTQRMDSDIGSAAYTLALEGLEPYYRKK